jgi:hypothetical protein
MKNRIEMLTKIIKTQFGVLYVKGKPGTGKSAIMKKIAENEGWNFIDLRLSEVDESDFLVPKVVENEDGTYTTHRSVMDIFRQANQEPTLIFFDELNRATQAVRNAALQVLLDRTVGQYRLNDNVFMASAGNLGEEDGCEVEEFENALKGRLITFKHELSFPEWKEAYADKNINPVIVSFLENSPEYMFKIPAENEDAYPSPRSWDFLSKYIEKNFGKGSSIGDWIEDIKMIGYCFVGQVVSKFIRYCEDQLAINVKDIINNFPKVKEAVTKMNRDRRSELLNDLKGFDLMKFCNETDKKKLDNIGEFIKIIDPDERMAFVDHVVEKIDISVLDGKKEQDKIFRNWIRTFRDVAQQELEITKKKSAKK